jgi:hypothetical protein
MVCQVDKVMPVADLVNPACVAAAVAAVTGLLMRWSLMTWCAGWVTSTTASTATARL